MTTATVPVVNVGDLLVVTNHDPETRIIKFNSRTYNLIPDRPVFVPAECVFLWFGDPRCNENMQSIRDEYGNVSYIVDRATEVRRLRLKYGIQGGDERQFDGFVKIPRRAVDIDEGEPFQIPNVEVATAEGEIVPTVFQDPQGLTVRVVQTTMSGDAELRAQLVRQQRQINALLEQLDLPSVPEVVEDDAGAEHMLPPTDEG